MSELTHTVLHAVGVKKHGSAAAVAALLGIDTGEVERVLAAALAAGRVNAVDGRYLLTPAGRMIVDTQYSRYCAAARADTAVLTAHARFEVVNNELKQLVTDWQTVTVGGCAIANDHADAAYDEQIIDRLGAVHDKVTPILAALANALPRYARYSVRLDHALERAEAGAHAWVSDATQDSYHTVWFDLHEDLLRVLGRTRVE